MNPAITEHRIKQVCQVKHAQCALQITAWGLLPRLYHALYDLAENAFTRSLHGACLLTKCTLLVADAESFYL
jgi:hypothetical protein